MYKCGVIKGEINRTSKCLRFFALLQQRNNQPNTNFLTFCAEFMYMYVCTEQCWSFYGALSMWVEKQISVNVELFLEIILSRPPGGSSWGECVDFFVKFRWQVEHLRIYCRKSHMSRQMTVEKNKTKEQQIYLLTYLFSFVTRRTSGVW